MAARIKAIYTQGVFAPVEPVAGLADNEIVQLQILPTAPDETIPTEEDEWTDLEDDPEWAAMSIWEQQGLRDPVLAPEELQARLDWVEANWGALRLSEEQALEIAMSDWLLEENLDL